MLTIQKKILKEILKITEIFKIKFKSLNFIIHHKIYTSRTWEKRNM